MKRRAAMISLIMLALLAVCPSAKADFPAGSGLPSRYDMREAGIVTPVKLQYPWGSCWSFGTIAAAETSILSAMGKTWNEYPLDLSELHAAWFAKHPVTEADDPLQAGEGWLVALSPDPKLEERLTLSNGRSSMVSGLFAAGAGPVEESAVPYRGKEQTPEAWVAMHEPEKWVADYQRLYADKVNIRGSGAEGTSGIPGQSLPAAPPFTEAQLRMEAEQALEKKQAELKTGFYLLWYPGDDWHLPELDENGQSMRMRRASWLLKDANQLPEPSVSAGRRVPRVLNEDGIIAMKQEMLKGHAVTALCLAESYSPAGGNENLYTNYDNWAQYTYDAEGQNHVICIVGWDDDYPAENFTHDVYVTNENGESVFDAERTAKTTPPGNGAWLVKNSRGSETDAVPGGMAAPDGTVYPEHCSNYGLLNGDGKHTGYNWISYYDQTLSDPETLSFVIEKEGEKSGILQYDYLNAMQSPLRTRQSEQPVSAANVFTAPRDMELTAVSTRTFTEKSQVVFTIVKLGDHAENPEDGEELDRFSEAYRYIGYHRTELHVPVFLKKGDRFSVITTTSYTGPDGKQRWQYASLMGAGNQVAAVVNPGESFVRENGIWQDWTVAMKYMNPKKQAGSESELYDNFGIKVFYR